MAYKRSLKSRHNTSGRALGTLTIAEYVNPMRRAYQDSHWMAKGISMGQKVAAMRWARKKGWTVRTIPHWNAIKVFDKEGNVTFSNQTRNAIYGHAYALEHCADNEPDL